MDGKNVKATLEANPLSTGRDGAIDFFGKVQGHTSVLQSRCLYCSSNGDCWYLVRDDQGLAVMHVPNGPSGGIVARMELGHFLSHNGNGPEKQALVTLIERCITLPE